ncbi:MAG: peptidoglycan bridge formation glycyltransferase FemA/FemB family protein [Candidatus Gracilibacteria bacterium]|nr:peptidoglycan bridge formation glycyltransferase FemA/FemB family protein [Candidatus Gracilibacteria bacterium]
MYKLKEIVNKNDWNNFIISNQDSFEFLSFLSSWEWGVFQELSGKKVFRFGIYKGEILIGVLPLIKNEAKRGTYLFAAHSPLILKEYDFFDIIGDLKNFLISFSKSQKVDFIRFNSPVKNTINNKNSFKNLGFIDAPMHEHAEDTHLLDLKISEDELLSNMKKEDRYYINRAIKEGVEIVIGNTNEQIDLLSTMHQNHSKKIGYHSFSADFIKILYDAFGDNITTISARYNGNIESILMTIRFANTCVYYIAASDIISHKFSPNYLCQWEAIKNAKENNCEIYNFWGVSPDNNPKHPIAGVSKFKRKFAGYDYSLLHAQDLPITKKYWINYLIESIRRKKRGYYYKKPE